MIETATQELALWRNADTVVPGGGVQTGYASTPDESSVPCLITKQTSGWAKREFGVDQKGQYRGVVEDFLALGDKDVVKITDGMLSGTYLMVRDAIPAIDEFEVVLVLEDTQERPAGA